MIAPKVTLEMPRVAVYALHEQKRMNNEIIEKMMVKKAKIHVFLRRFEHTEGILLILCKLPSMLPQFGHI